jgi:hypothetical protein
MLSSFYKNMIQINSINYAVFKNYMVWTVRSYTNQNYRRI